MNSSQHDGFLVVSTRGPGEGVLVSHVAALVDQAVVNFVEFTALSICVDHVESEMVTHFDAASALLSEENVAVAAALVDRPQLA